MSTTTKLCIFAGVALGLAACDRTREPAAEAPAMEEPQAGAEMEAGDMAERGQMREMPEPAEPAAETIGVADIVDTARASGQFETLVSALQTAEMLDTLEGEGPFTVFAPNDEAFAELPEGSLEDLMKADNRERLREVLSYHVVRGDMRASDIMTEDYLGTVHGEDLAIETVGNEVRVDGATVIQSDIECTNGVIHVIDAVLMPPE